MRLAFMGSPDFAVPALRALVAAGHEVAAVYCQQPRPAGRGQSVRRAPVHVAADELGLPVRTPVRLRADHTAQAAFAALDLEAAVVAAYGLILPQPMLEAPRRGCLNIHASLLPRWRGAAPIQAAILAGDPVTGVTIMQMDAGLDTGGMLLDASVPITSSTTAADLHDALAGIGARLVLQALDEALPARPQPDEGVTYAPKLTREDGRIDWRRDSASLDRQVRALNPWPGTFTTRAGEVLKVLRAVPMPEQAGPEQAGPEQAGPEQAGPEQAGGSPGTVLDELLTVACGAGALRLVTVQRPGRAAMGAAELARGLRLPPGTRLG